MTVIDGMASLVITSDVYGPADVTRILGIEPEWTAEKGEPRIRKDGGDVALRRRFYETSVWALEVESNPATKMAVDEDAYKAFATLHVLVEMLFGRGPMLADLRRGYKVELSWFGTTSSPQAAFTLPLQLMRDIGELGVDLIANVYPYEGE